MFQSFFELSQGQDRGLHFTPAERGTDGRQDHRDERWRDVAVGKHEKLLATCEGIQGAVSGGKLRQGEYGLCRMKKKLLKTLAERIAEEQQKAGVGSRRP